MEVAMPLISKMQRVMEYFAERPNASITIAETQAWLDIQDSWLIRGDTRTLEQVFRVCVRHGLLRKLRSAEPTYRYDPEYRYARDQIQFTSAERLDVFTRDEFRCVRCGMGAEYGMEIRIEHIMPPKPQETEIGNAWVLCKRHKGISLMGRNKQKTTS
jgi:hypothetical protein